MKLPHPIRCLRELADTVSTARDEIVLGIEARNQIRDIIQILSAYGWLGADPVAEIRDIANPHDTEAEARFLLWSAGALQDGDTTAEGLRRLMDWHAESMSTLYRWLAQAERERDGETPRKRWWQR